MPLPTFLDNIKIKNKPGAEAPISIDLEILSLGSDGSRNGIGSPLVASGGHLSLSLSFPPLLSLFFSFLTPPPVLIGVSFPRPKLCWSTTSAVQHALNQVVQDGSANHG